MALSRYLMRTLFRRLAEPEAPLPPEPDSAPANLAHNAELEASIAESPDDAQRWLVYADWLQGEGDPRGELIAVQHAMSQTTDPETLVTLRQRDRALRTHWTSSLTRLAGHRFVTLEWHFGHITSARLHIDLWSPTESESVPTLLRALLDDPCARFLRELRIGVPYLDGDQHYHEVVALLAERAPPLLRHLHIGDFEAPDDYEVSWMDVGSVEPLWQALPNLRHLVVQGADIELGTIEARQLRHLELRTGALPREPVQALVRADLPALETLKLWTGDPNHGAEISVDDIVPLLSKDLPALRHLGLMNCDYADALILPLVQSRLLPQLKTLDLSMGTLSDTGGQRLLDHAEAFAHLDELELSPSYLEHTISALTARGFRVGTQFSGVPEEDRYVVVGE